MRIYLNTVSDLLWNSLQQLMAAEEFNQFRLVGGTSLSLQLGHRESVDIDLFTDAEYGSINFHLLESKLDELFPFVDGSPIDVVGMGKSYFVGNSKIDLVKLDLFYTDNFISPFVLEQGVRFCSTEDIAAMKLEVIANNGRKKDFWDLHELLNVYTLNEMFGFYGQRNPYGATREELRLKIVDFTNADDDFTPNCFKQKEWELIKLDLERMVK